MPFTFSHPAAVLPLMRGLRGRGPLVASALVAGSMAPDLPFFAESWHPGLFRRGALTHRWWAVPTVDVVLAGVLVAGWQGLLRRPLLGLLPPRWAAPALAATERRAAGGGPGERAAWFALSAALGAAGHVGWDAFTHSGRAGVRLLPALERRVAGVPLCTVAQYGSSALALAGLGGYLARELRAAATAPLTGDPASTGQRHPATARQPDAAQRPTEAQRPTDAQRPAEAWAVGPRTAAARTAAARTARRRAVVAAGTVVGAAHRVVRAGRVRGPGGRPDLIADLCFGAIAGAVTAAAALGALDLGALDPLGRPGADPR
ncbi:DUF4184 family protein [Kitasatospora sp. NBC_01287]|uniref:DUF4184 family protein n=1 Tax=Kitasatospora sp. NBC_01287 TaxID=2903573 RepID=UPI00225110F3|nr:DUF4184 family protein [Kitasatospora sp. NBC_01287]MCX4750684.1 DUF4184 family protein [Kitasatospora sp. NBC_01287]